MDLSDEITWRSTNGFSHSLALKIPGYARFRYYWYIYQQGDKMDTTTTLQAC